MIQTWISAALLSTMLFFSTPSNHDTTMNSVETYLQANARINRPGQKNSMTIVHIKGSDIESRLYKMLSNNINNHTKIIDLYRQEIENIV